MSTRGYYSSLDKKIHLNLHKVDVQSMEAEFKTNIITFLHESGHWFDYNALDIQIRDKLPKLKDLKEILLLKIKIFSDISKEIGKTFSTNSSISDIFEGVTNA